MNAHRNLGIANAGLTKSLERLSSGFRINRAADDAAGLAISQAFRADIASFKVASRNASEANAMLQVAEGASEQIGNMLIRLKELATQAASANAGSNLSKIDAEKEKLLTEIDKIANSTEYADTSLIDGSYGVEILGTGSDLTSAQGFTSISGMKAGYSYVLNVADTASSKADIEIKVYDAGSGAGTLIESQTVYDTDIPGTGNTTTITFDGLGLDLTVNTGLNELINGDADAMITASSAGSSTFQLGAESDSNNQINVSMGGLTQSDLGISAIEFDSASEAQTAMGLIDTAIGTVNTVRGNIGATMNQIGYHTANLASAIENMQAAESVIRDVDMAAEMSTFTKNQILLQASTAMLAQANMAPQQVLALFG